MSQLLEIFRFNQYFILLVCIATLFVRWILREHLAEKSKNLNSLVGKVCAIWALLALVLFSVFGFLLGDSILDPETLFVGFIIYMVSLYLDIDASINTYTEIQEKKEIKEKEF